ncbi:MAG TPA: SLC13 family permease [Syntrophales bacterium]|nr:SLC13 family permease [Syntrophales bacterium]
MAADVQVPINHSSGVLGFFKRYRAIIFFIAAILIALIVAQLPISDLPREGQITLAIFTFVVVLWIGEVLPVGVAALLFALLLPAFLGKKMPASVVFSGFANPTIWLITGAFLLGEATVTTGVAQRIAYLTMRLGGSSYRMLLIYLWLAQTLLGLLTPSTTVRAAMFIPIMIGIVQAYKARPDSRFAANLLIHVYWAQVLGATLWYTGSIINPQVMGILKAVTGYAPSYFVYVAWNVIPCAIFAVGTFLLIEWVMPPEKEIVSGGNVDFLNKKLAEMGPMSADEWKALVFFLVAIVFWATEKIHRIDTATVALVVGALLFLPNVGVLKPKSLNNINWDIILLMAVALGITEIMKVAKLDIWVTSRLLAPILNPVAALGSAGLAFGISIAVGLIHFIAASAAGETALVAPLVLKFAHVSGYDTILAALVTDRAEMNVFLFPYQVTPLLVLWGTGYIDMKKCLRCSIATCIFNIVWITAMAPLWSWSIRLLK